MADVMEDRVASIQLGGGVSFVAGALLILVSLGLFPSLPPANQTGQVLEAISREPAGSWMGLHAIMALGFVLASIGFAAFAFLLHLRGSSGPASAITVCALIGGSLWAVFLSMEFFAGPFLKNLYPVDPGLATMLFTLAWFWKMGALALGAVLIFAAVVTAGIAGTARGIVPLWLGYGGAFFGIIGILVYVFEFWSSTPTGSAINPMRNGAIRFGIGLPLQLWMIAMGAILLRERKERVPALPPQAPTPVPKRDPAKHAPAPPSARVTPGGPAPPAASEPPVLPPPIP
ncbi:MAG TPA: hypothetical protein VFP58_07240 [Candidatus Eisenbacteria bacterium]|nr:hypothetical protein [Candidatus Eisenbacteria bacterium]